MSEYPYPRKVKIEGTYRHFFWQIKKHSWCKASVFRVSGCCWPSSPSHLAHNDLLLYVDSQGLVEHVLEELVLLLLESIRSIRSSKDATLCHLLWCWVKGGSVLIAQSTHVLFCSHGGVLSCGAGQNFQQAKWATVLKKIAVSHDQSCNIMHVSERGKLRISEDWLSEWSSCQCVLVRAG